MLYQCDTHIVHGVQLRARGAMRSFPCAIQRMLGVSVDRSLTRLRRVVPRLASAGVTRSPVNLSVSRRHRSLETGMLHRHTQCDHNMISLDLLLFIHPYTVRYIGTFISVAHEKVSVGLVLKVAKSLTKVSGQDESGRGAGGVNVWSKCRLKRYIIIHERARPNRTIELLSAKAGFPHVHRHFPYMRHSRIVAWRETSKMPRILSLAR